ncbi:hypothetical protein DPMN_076252 [Dreissena polymorpha]|uniref:Uncharacterized protein n=1 Tax=Dreissena polymorpha TaxID=45954 RepID=A0A9D4BM90_DREPO|nr:hypothetical protein DPMN_076252 [Dreissena polymorpha]
MLENLGGQKVTQGAGPASGNTPTKQCQTSFCARISFINHPSKVMLHLVLN